MTPALHLSWKKLTIDLLLALLALCAHAEESPDLRIAVVVPLGSNIRGIAQDALNVAALGAKAGMDRVKALS